jgi:hypothetical protein
MSIRAYADVLIATIFHLMPKGAPETKGKVFAVSVRVALYSHEPGRPRPPMGGMIHLAVVADRNYVDVYAAHSDQSKSWGMIEDWTRVCSHDSAWREDGVRATLVQTHDTMRKAALVEWQCESKGIFEQLSIDQMGVMNQTSLFSSRNPAEFPRGALTIAAA